MPSISVNDRDNIGRKLEQLSGVSHMQNVLRKPFQRGGLRIQRDMADYPPAPPRSRYRRTGTYGRRWTTRTTDTRIGLQTVVGNNTVYGPLVGSAQFQTRTHRRTGWTTDEQAARQNEDAIVRDVERTLQAELDS